MKHLFPGLFLTLTLSLCLNGAAEIPAADAGDPSVLFSHPENPALFPEESERTDSTLTEEEKTALLERLLEANCPKSVFEAHTSATIVHSSYDREKGIWVDFAETYCEKDLRFQDDWTLGYEELRYLVTGSDLIQQYEETLGYILFLNSTDLPYVDFENGPLFLSSRTREEILLRTEQDEHHLYLLTRVPESDQDSDKGQDEVPDAFASVGEYDAYLYSVDPETFLLSSITLSTQREDGTSELRRAARIFYDQPKDTFLEEGMLDLTEHLFPEKTWDSSNLRTVTVTLNPDADDRKVFVKKALRGDAVSITLPEGFHLYTDEACTIPWIDDGDAVSDLTLYASLPKEGSPMENAAESIGTAPSA